jgi:hypothetical protein
LLETAVKRGFSDGELREVATDVAERRRDPYTVVDEIMARLGI